ncbi:mitochondrial carrier protein [Nitzschia inconspicua]|uniref:Mitochondrial carrier protein n=1 Tax=Nitzschia inconspicua TaxID=303405 RepID=A0A9K3PEM3_9STRA|nr:mitochondrial carrier protein [Nitzschia inconspicua]
MESQMFGNNNSIHLDNGVQLQQQPLHTTVRFSTILLATSSSSSPPTTTSLKDEVSSSLSSSSSSSTSSSTPPPIPPPPTNFLTALIAGGLAGTSVDVALFPIDTIKTRLQSPQGFLQAGGFRGIYNGLGAAAVGSAPGAALFFSTYETCKPILLSQLQQQRQYPLGDDDDFTTQQHSVALSHMLAASIGEAAACLVRVPTEVIKAKMQTNTDHALSLTNTIRLVWNETHGGSPLSQWTGGLYRGYGITLMREIPFAMIQFPIYEYCKVYWADQYRHGVPVNPIEAAACGSFSGGIAAAVTTPLDVIKTRLMLGSDREGRLYQGVGDVIRKTSAEGYGVFLSGIQPRVMWISLGGFVFFGAYEAFKSSLSPLLVMSSSSSSSSSS